MTLGRGGYAGKSLLAMQDRIRCGKTAGNREEGAVRGGQGTDGVLGRWRRVTWGQRQWLEKVLGQSWL